MAYTICIDHSALEDKDKCNGNISRFALWASLRPSAEWKPLRGGFETRG
jgi:hypothetical protein